MTAAGAIFQIDNVHLAFPFCFANKAQAKAEALLRRRTERRERGG